MSCDQQCHLADRVRQVLASYPEIRVAFLFGSLAKGTAGFTSDLDLGVAAPHPLSSERRYEIMGALAIAVKRPVDLIDLRIAGATILKTALAGNRVLVADTLLFASLIIRSIMLAEDFEPARRTILEQRRKAWIGI